MDGITGFKVGRRVILALALGLCCRAAILLGGQPPDDNADAKRLIEVLDLHEGSVVADIGAGSGELTILIAAHVGQTGKVLQHRSQQDPASRDSSGCGEGEAAERRGDGGCGRSDESARGVLRRDLHEECVPPLRSSASDECELPRVVEAWRPAGRRGFCAGLWRERCARSKGERQGSWCDRGDGARRSEGCRLRRRAAEPVVVAGPSW